MRGGREERKCLGRVREMLANVPIAFFLPVWRSREFQSNRLGRDRFAANGKASGPLFGKCHYRVAAWEECGESENVPSFPKKKKVETGTSRRRKGCGFLLLELAAVFFFFFFALWHFDQRVKWAWLGIPIYCYHVQHVNEQRIEIGARHFKFLNKRRPLRLMQLIN